MEQQYMTETRKRKLDRSMNKENKKKKFESMFTCDLCDRRYQHKSSLNRHLMTHLTSFTCEKCNKSFTRKSILKTHQEKCTNADELDKKSHTSATLTRNTCKHCGVPFDDVDSLLQHVATNHPLNQSGGDLSAAQNIPTAKMNEENDKQRKSGLNNVVTQLNIIPRGNEKYDLLQFLANVKDDVKKELILRRNSYRNIKWYVNARVEMVRDIDDGNEEKAHPHFRSKSYISLANEDNDHNLNEAFQSINRAMENFISKGSNWILNKVMHLELYPLPYSPKKTN